MFFLPKNLARHLVAATDVLVDLKKELDKELVLTMLLIRWR